ncbi:unnamed protein product [Ceratitis capitata]|uniref:(Mediterranean fruit fly) hypothetical protein n=1 Tax=Ceratitis capitata TaxID=7213 RepID=A0A811UIT3_CERCA|nr:unnamed protein product [Ceratitis capitata]
MLTAFESISKNFALRPAFWYLEGFKKLINLKYYVHTCIKRFSLAQDIILPLRLRKLDSKLVSSVKSSPASKPASSAVDSCTSSDDCRSEDISPPPPLCNKFSTLLFIVFKYDVQIPIYFSIFLINI